MGLDLEISISALTVFAQGLLSFFSPCVLPLVPLYVGYLSGGARTVEADGTIRYRRGRVMRNTVFFVAGVSFAFFLLGLGFTAAGQFLSRYHRVFTWVGGILIILFGVYQLGILGSSRFLATERRLPFRLDRVSMSPVTALVLGFTFSFAWTPCVGPALTSVLLMASSASSAARGFLLIGVYTLGFILPFLAVGLFTGTLLDFFKRHQKVVRYTAKIGGALMILVGVLMLTGWLSRLSLYISQMTGDTGGGEETTERQEETPDTPAPPAEGEDASQEELVYPPAPDFTLTDQFGQVHTLSDYQGKTVFLNFWATWCGPCKAEMPAIQSLYEDWEENSGELVVLGVANPGGIDGTEEEIAAFLEQNGYTYPVAMDATGEVFAQYGIYSYPITFMITPEGTVYGYVPGSIPDRELMDSIVEQTMDAAAPREELPE